MIARYGVEEAADFGKAWRPTGGIVLEVNDSHGDVHKARSRTATSAATKHLCLYIEIAAKTLDDIMAVVEHPDCVRKRQRQREGRHIEELARSDRGLVTGPIAHPRSGPNLAQAAEPCFPPRPWRQST